ncbi:gliding motility-associated C-terminal domain-containing protein [Tenacibaculum aiptasiae]|uniref:Gliding motility-associated C-terminal domain-containing protein n=1 Tax=Tenacibaculum aiptasiae TaxID=426481 RepID=A0A7J5AIG0_9FLAO|nr:gliding motility-associated C-terminal domain-containing protein [Tenacibaculum aiptasiae]KAB1157300.1 gliding motility-associated C-terminal domain-containing protein [Tenacibaculum aiptasiae]
MKKLSMVIIIMVFIRSTYSFGQTINEGDLYVTPNTTISLVNDFENTNTGNFVNEGEMYVYANFKNDGLVDFLTPNGTANFIGANVQQISGSEVSRFNNVLFNNTSNATPFQLSGRLNVYNEADFSSGIVDNTNFNGTITFEQNATHTNTSNTSHVDGYVHKEGDTEFEFPVGDKNFYRASKISAPLNTREVIKSKYFLENSNTLYPHNLKVGVIKYIDTNEYWEITQENGNSNVIVTLTWNNNTTSSTITQATSKTAIHIVRWDPTQGFWVDEGGIVDELTNSVTTVSEATGYGVFALALVKEELILPGGCLTVYNGLSTNDDGKNDVLEFNCIENYPDNTVKIFNKSGVKIFETKGYNNKDKSFRGYSDGRLTLNRNDRLPKGTYYYILEYKYNSEMVKRAGYLFIN